MKSKLLACLALLSSALAVVAQSSVFTYQGHLEDGGISANGSFDLRFTLQDAATFGTALGSPVTNSPVVVSNGLFTVTLGFGASVFDGNARWLEIGVRTNGSTNAFVTLSPRQPITATPYAIRAANYSGTLGSTNITGKINDTNLSVNVALLTNNVVFTRTVTASNFVGNGITLTNLSTTNLVGTLPDARLSTNVAMLNTNNVFFGSITATNFYGLGSGLTNVPGRIFDSVPTSANIQAFANFGYLATNDVTPVVVTLPLTANIPVGNIVRVSGIGTAGWIIAQNAGQTILVANLLKNVGLAWRTNATSQQWKAVAASQDGQRLAGVVGVGVAYITTNAGLTWFASGLGSADWKSVACSADGLKLVAVGAGVNIYTSVNGGTNWTQRVSGPAAVSVASSWDGVKLAACVNGGQIWVSTDSGVNWAARESNRGWSAIASSGDGVNLVACVNGGQIWTSSNSGANWTARDTARPWICVASSSDGGTLVAGATGGLLYVSYDYGATWIATGPTATAAWTAVSCSADGLRMIAAVGGSPGAVYVSQDSGATWQIRNNLPGADFKGVACSGDGGTMAAVATANQIYVSSQTSTTLGITGQLIGSRLSAVELEHVGNGVFIPISYAGNIRAK